MTMVSRPSDFKNGASVAKLTASAVRPDACSQATTNSLPSACSKAGTGSTKRRISISMSCSAAISTSLSFKSRSTSAYSRPGSIRTSKLKSSSPQILLGLSPPWTQPKLIVGTGTAISSQRNVLASSSRYSDSADNSVGKASMTLFPNSGSDE